MSFEYGGFEFGGADGDYLTSEWLEVGEERRGESGAGADIGSMGVVEQVGARAPMVADTDRHLPLCSAQLLLLPAPRPTAHLHGLGHDAAR